jgi:integrase
VIPVIGKTKLQDLSPQRLGLLYEYLLTKGRVKGGGGPAPKTVQNVHRMLRRALRDAVKWDLVPRNVAEDALAPRVPRRCPNVWSPEQLRSFVEHVRDDRFFALWLLVVTTGFRRGELAGLLRHDIDFQNRRVTPSAPRVVVAGRAQESETKTASGIRWLALDPDTWEALHEYIQLWDKERYLLGQPTQLLFVWPNGDPLHPDTITALFHKRCAAAGLPRIRLHDVRHSYATAALKAGIPPKGDQRTARPLDGCLHDPDLRPRHPGHGRRRRRQGRCTHSRRFVWTHFWTPERRRACSGKRRTR